MFKSLSSKKINKINPSGRSYLSESLQLEGDIKSPGCIDIAGLVKGNVYVGELSVQDTGSIKGNIEVTRLEVEGHIEGKIVADEIILGEQAVIKGDILFRNSLKTEEGADIDGYIQRIKTGKSVSEEDIKIEEIVQRPEIKKPRLVTKTPKEAV